MSTDILSDPRQCRDCREFKSLDEFGINRKRSDGRQSRCRQCHKAIRRLAIDPPEGYVPPDEKACTRCKVVKPMTAFSPNRQMWDGRQSHCRDCSNAQRRAFAASPRGKLIVAAWEQKAKRKQHYGITDEEYVRLRDSQGGVCAICKRPPSGKRTTKVLAVDHDHATGRIRGLLCPRCNASLGAFGDTVEGLMKAIAYLEGGSP